MKLRNIILAGALCFALAPSFAQVNPGTSPLSIPKGGTGAATASAARTNLGLAIGSNVEAWDTDLDCLAALATAGVLQRTGSGTCAALTNAQLTALINPATASLPGALPAWPNNTTTFFRGDGTYAALPAGILQNTLNAKTANYTIANTDCGNTISGTGGPWTLTLPSVSGFAATCVVQACNTDPNDNTHHAIKLSGFPIPSFARLYMQQCEAVSIENGAWTITKFPGRFRPTFAPTLFVDTGGSSTNDGFVSNAAANAIDSCQDAFNTLNNEYDLLGSQPVISVTVTQNCGPMSIVGQLVNSSVIFVSGNGGQGISRGTATTGTAALFLGDFAPYVISTNMTWDCTGAATNCTALSLHQQGGMDLNAGTILKGGASTHVALNCDSMCKINFNALVTLSGTLSSGFNANLGSIFNVGAGIATLAATAITNSIFQLNSGSQLTFSGPLTAVATTTVAEMFTLRGASTACLSIGTVTGSFGTPRQWSVLSNSVLANTSATAVPGSAGINTATNFVPGQTPIGTSAAGC